MDTTFPEAGVPIHQAGGWIHRNGNRLARRSNRLLAVGGILRYATRGPLRRPRNQGRHANRAIQEEAHPHCGSAGPRPADLLADRAAKVFRSVR